MATNAGVKMTETRTIEIEVYRSNDGKPSCGYKNDDCVFYRPDWQDCDYSGDEIVRRIPNKTALFGVRS